MLSLILAWTIVGVIGLAGVILALAPGRFASRDPHCRKCRFNLAGVVDAPQLTQAGAPLRCPECGVDLAAKRAVRPGLRRRSRVRLAFAGCWMLLALAGAGALSWSAVAGFNWSRVKPLWLLEIEASASDAANATPALEELARRAGVGDLADARLSRLARESLAIQADPSATWIDWRGDLIEHAAKADLLTDEELVEYAKRTMRFSLVSPGRLHAGDTFSIRMRIDSDRPPHNSSSAVTVWARLGALEIGDRDKPPMSTTLIARPGRYSAQGGGGFESDDLPPGVYEATGRLVVRAYRGLSNIDPRAAVMVGNAAGDFPEGAIATWEQDISTSLEVVPPDTPLVQLTPDPALAERLQQLLSVREARVWPPDDADERLLGVYISGPHPAPADLACAVFVRAGERELKLNEGVVFNKERGGGWAHADALPGWFDADAVDVILRADAKVAREEGVLGEIWDGELIFENVPVRWTTPKPAPTGAADIPPGAKPD